MDATVEVGDTAFDTTTGLMQVCTAVGPVVWTPQSAGGGGANYYAPTFIVGNTAQGDVAGTNCDFVDAAGIVSALAALPVTGGWVHIKRGTYTLTSFLEITLSNTTVTGDGAATIIVPDATALPAFEMPAENSRLQNLAIRLSATVPASAAHIINVEGSCIVSDIIIDATNLIVGVGTLSRLVTVTSLSGVVMIRGCFLGNVTVGTVDGIDASGVDNAAEMQIKDNVIDTITGAGIRSGGTGNQITGNQLLAITGTDIVDTGTSNLILGNTLLGGAIDITGATTPEVLGNVT